MAPPAANLDAAVVPSVAEGPQPRVSPALLARALDLPRDAEDTAGFEALRHALEDTETADLIRAALAVLEPLRADGLALADLPRGQADADLWRRWARGEAPLGALCPPPDVAVLVRLALRHAGNPAFGQAMERFRDRHATLLHAMATTACDADLLALASSRTTGAFLLVAWALDAMGNR